MKVTDNKFIFDTAPTAPEQATHATADFSLELDKAVAKNQEDSLTYEKDLLKRQTQDTVSEAALPFVPVQLLDLQQQGAAPEHTLAATLPQEHSDVPGAQNSAPGQTPATALASVSQALFSQMSKTVESAKVSLEPGFSLRGVQLKEEKALPVVPFDKLYSELVKYVKTMKTGTTLRLKMALEPDKLGTIDVYMVLDGEQKIAVLFAAKEDTRALLEKSGGDLATQLAKDGYALNGMHFMDFASSGHQAFEEAFTGQNGENTHNGAEMLNILGQPDIINSVNKYITSSVVNFMA